MTMRSKILANVDETSQTNTDVLLALEWLRQCFGRSNAPREMDDLYDICGNRFTRWFRRLRRKPCEGDYPINQFNKFAKKVLKNPQKLDYSPDLLRICLKLAKSKIAVLPKARLARQRLVEAIQNSIDRVQHEPSNSRVLRQMNDFQLVYGSEKKKVEDKYGPAAKKCRTKLGKEMKLYNENLARIQAGGLNSPKVSRELSGDLSDYERDLGLGGIRVRSVSDAFEEEEKLRLHTKLSRRLASAFDRGSLKTDSGTGSTIIPLESAAEAKLKEVAKIILDTPKTLNYSPYLLQLCLELADSENPTLVRAIQDSIARVPSTPSAVRVQRQMNDLRLVLESGKKLPGCLLGISGMFELRKFDGTEGAIKAALWNIQDRYNEFSRIGSAAHMCYVKLVEELNLYCLSVGKHVKWDPQLHNRELPQDLVVELLGDLAEKIAPKDYKKYLVTAGLHGSDNEFIKRTLKEKFPIGITIWDDKSLSSANSLATNSQSESTIVTEVGSTPDNVGDQVDADGSQELKSRLENINQEQIAKTEAQFKEFAKIILETQTPQTLDYSPYLLQNCLQLAKREQPTLVPAIKNSIASVPNAPSVIRVQRQINDLRFILQLQGKGNSKNVFDIILRALKTSEFDGSDRETNFAVYRLGGYLKDFEYIGSAARNCYIKLIEELNLYCLSVGRTEAFGFKSRELPQDLVVELLGDLADKIAPEDYKKYLVTAGLPGSDNEFIKRTLKEKFSIGITISPPDVGSTPDNVGDQVDADRSQELKSHLENSNEEINGSDPTLIERAIRKDAMKRDINIADRIRNDNNDSAGGSLSNADTDLQQSANPSGGDDATTDESSGEDQSQITRL